MEFLYPKFDKVTHSIKNSRNISIKYPRYKTSSGDKDYDVAEGALVVLIRENVGYNNEWSLVKVIDSSLISAEYFNKQFYILSNNLENIGQKQSYIPDRTEFLQINPDAAEINPIYQEIFLPYVDSRNGLFSIRIQVDYERILDLKMFEKVLEDVYLEGVNVLLAARGFRSDNDTIYNLRDKYYCFAYINKDLDQTVRRPCEPLTFTVSIPLNFFNDDTEIKESTNPVVASQHVTFTVSSFVTNIEVLIALLSQKAPDISRITYPNKAIENFLLDFEINALRGFAVATNEIMSLANSPIEQNPDYVTNYDIGLDKNFNIASVNIKKYNRNGEIIEEIDFAEGLLAQCRLRGEFNNKRIFNYLLNINSMVENNSIDTLEYLTQYVKFPSVRLVDEFIQIDDIVIPPEDVAQFRMSFERDSESCVNVSDIINLANQANVTAQNINSIGHMFMAKDPRNTINQGQIASNLNSNLTTAQDDAKKNVFVDTALRIWTGITGAVVNAPSAIGGGLANTAQATADITEQVGGMFAEEFKFENNYKTNLNTLAYIAKRLNLQEIIFQKIFCWLKGTNPNAEEVAELLSELPFEVYNYFRFLKQRDLKGVDYIRALEEGVSFEAQLICSDEVAYFIKGLTKFLSTTNVVLSRTISFINEIEQAIKRLRSLGKGKNPYDLIIKSVSKTLYNVLTNFIFEYLRDCLITDCDEPILDGDVDNFYDPYSTHHPVDRFGRQENNNQDQIKKNRLKALEETVPDIVRTLTFGPDVEYTIDLIGRLIKDINCILTLSENLDLLKGVPSDEVIVLIKNIIRNKYSKDPNNLTYLLNTDKLKLFFAKLGLKVDPGYIEKLSDPVIQLIKKNGLDVCTPEQFEVRASILNNKIPKELDVLADDSRRRVEKARELVEKLKNNEIVYNISALCPDVEDADIDEFKNYLFDQYNDSVISTFTNTLTLFNEEANKVPDKYTEAKQFIRQDSNKNIIGIYPYNTYNTNLYNNLNIELRTDNRGIVSPRREGEEGYINNYSYFYRNQNPISDEELTDSLLGAFTSEIAAIDQCSSDANLLETDPVFKRMVEEGRILYERRPEYISEEDYWIVVTAAIAAGLIAGGLVAAITSGAIALAAVAIIDLAFKLGINIGFWQEKRNWDSIAKPFSSRDAITESEFLKQLKQESLELHEYIKEKKYVIFVDSEDLRTTDSYSKIIFRLVYYSPFVANAENDGEGDYLLLKEVSLKYNQNQDTNDNNRGVIVTDQGFSTYTGEWNSRKGYDRLSDPVITGGIRQFYARNYPLIKNFYRIERDASVDSEYTVRVIGTNFLPQPPNFSTHGDSGVNVSTGVQNPVLVFNIVQTIVKQLTDTILEKILIYENTLGSLEKLNKHGLFYMSNNRDTNEIMVKVATTSPQGALVYDNFYVNSIKNNESFKDHIENSLNAGYDDGGDLIIFKKYVDHSYNINALYKYFLNNIGSYVKPSYLKEEFALYNPAEYGNGPEKHGPLAFSSASVTNPAYEMVRNPEYVDIYREEYQKIAILNYEQNVLYAICNLYPHYLNLQYFLSSYIDMYKPLLCDDNLSDIPIRILDAVLVRFTIRTYITDQLVKVIPFLTTLDLQDLNYLHMEQFVVDVMREHMRSEMGTFTTNRNKTDQNSYYLKFLNRKVKKLFKDDLENKKITEFYVTDTSIEENKEIDYYIRKEIRHFIKFAIEKNIFIPRNISLYKENINKLIKSSEPVQPRNPDGDSLAIQHLKTTVEKFLNLINSNKEYLRQEYYKILLYLLMTCTVDVQKRNLFMGTKSELARLFFENINTLSEPEDEGTYEEKPDEDIINFITKIGFSSNPSALATLNPDYSKYISFFLEAALEETRSILLNSSMFIDKNITVTRTINYILATISGLTWSFMDQKTRDQLLADAAVNNRSLGLLYKRAESAMSPIPDLITSLGVGAASRTVGFPGEVGRYYLLFDSIKEIMWATKVNQELAVLAADLAAQNETDPCEVTTPDTQEKLEECTVEKRDELLAEFNRFEED